MKTREQRTCRECGKSFDFKPSQLNKYPNAGKYCSRACGYVYRVKKNANKPSSDRWGRTRRRADVEWTTAVRERDNYTCQRCGKYDQHIHTHHIATRSKRPDLKHDVSNGVCLCGSCHQWVHNYPIEAGEQGYLSNASYELERLNKKKQELADKARSSRTGLVKQCIVCGKERYYPGANRHISQKQYRCWSCYTSTHIKRNYD